MHDIGLKGAIAEFFNSFRKSLDLCALQKPSSDEAFFNGSFSEPHWANFHSGLGEMTQVIRDENSAPGIGPKPEIAALNSILDIRYRNHRRAIGRRSPRPVT